jgi:hypothetical protein
MDRLSHSLSAIKEFRRMMDEREGVPKAVVPALPDTEKGVLKTKLALADSDTPEPVNTASEETHPDFRRDWDSRNMTMWDETKAEFNLVMRVFWYVLHQWTLLPGRL